MQVIQAPKLPGSKVTLSSTLNHYLMRSILRKEFLFQTLKLMRKNVHLLWHYFLQLITKPPTTPSNYRPKVKERKYIIGLSRNQMRRGESLQLEAG
jgi:hypothetical protein